jgi:membrane protein
MNSRIENMAGWFAAAVLVAGAVILAVKREAADASSSASLRHPTPAQEPLAVQALRAKQSGRGRKAETPSQISWRGWKDIGLRTYWEIQSDRLLALAAGVAFYSLIALFPAVAAAVSIYALFAAAGTISKHLSLAADIVPAATIDMLREEIVRVAATSEGKLTLGFLFGLGLALWSANAGMKAIFDALNIIYDEQEKRSLVRLNLVSLFFTLCAIGVALLAIGAVAVFPLLLAAFDLSSIDQPVIGYLRWPVMFGLAIFGLAMLYRYGPSRRLAKWRWVSVGSVLAAVTWLGVSSLLSWYLGNVANYNATYGALGAVVGLMIWMWLSIVVVLVGAELNSEIEHQTARDSTVGVDKPLGVRGAVMADTVGVAEA